MKIIKNVIMKIIKKKKEEIINNEKKENIEDKNNKIESMDIIYDIFDCVNNTKKNTEELNIEICKKFNARISDFSDFMRRVKFMTKDKKLDNSKEFKKCTNEKCKCYGVLINNKKCKLIPLKCFYDDKNNIKKQCIFCREIDRDKIKSIKQILNNSQEEEKKQILNDSLEEEENKNNNNNELLNEVMNFSDDENTNDKIEIKRKNIVKNKLENKDTEINNKKNSKHTTNEQREYNKIKKQEYREKIREESGIPKKIKRTKEEIKKQGKIRQQRKRENDKEKLNNKK
jgi:hypothetical protein